MSQMLFKLILACILYSSTLIADGQERSAIEMRERAASQLNNYINHLDRSYAYYQQVRDQKFYGTSGIEKKMTEFFQRTITWVDKWSSIMQLIDVSKVETIDQIYHVSQRAFEDQEAELHDLQRLAQHIMIQAEQALHTLGELSLPKFDPSMPNPDILQATQKNVTQLQNTVQTLQRVLEQRLSELERIKNLSWQACVTKLKQGLLASGRFPLEQSMQRFQELVQLQAIAGAALAELVRKENDLDRLVLNLAYFQAEERYADIKKDCQKTQQNLLSLSSVFAKQARLRVQQLCQAADSHWQALNSLGLERYELVFEYSSLLQHSVRKECGKKQAVINCEQAALMQAVGLKQLQSMPDDRLRFVEMTWADWEEKLAISAAL